MGDAAHKLTENTPKNTPPWLTPWKPGCPSPNPGGRPKGLASYIRENTLDGRELADFLIAVVRGGERVFCKMNDRLKACEMLLDRGFGRLPDLAVEEKMRPVIDLGKLTPEQIDKIERFGLLMASIRDRVASGETQAQSP